MTEERATDGMDASRTEMLTVRKLIDYLRTCNPDACILAFEPNSNAYIEQFPDLPNAYICTVSENKTRDLVSIRGFYRGCVDAELSVQSEMDEIYRYAKDDDIVVNF